MEKSHTSRTVDFRKVGEKKMKRWILKCLIWMLGDTVQGPELDGVRCGSCQNFFWIADAHLEAPTFCPYCGIRFTGHRKISGADFNNLGN
jgi:hypothetical protein